jgi:hypothetical protein
MNEPEKPRIEDVTEELEFWNAYRHVYRGKGIDIANVYQRLAESVKEALTSPIAKDDFSELCEAGCLPLGVAALALLLKYSPFLKTFWMELVGQPKNREKATRSLEEAVQMLETLYGGVVGDGSVDQKLTDIGRIPITRIVEELRVHIRVINLARLLGVDTQTRSPAELFKYLLTSYVKRMTGRFHDRSVSGLIGDIVGPRDYDEVAHRMWRSRNYNRLETHFAWMTKFLVAMSVAIAHTA